MVPNNLDALDSTELAKLSREYLEAGELLFAYSDYARLRVKSIEARERGAIRLAQTIEKRLEGIYQNLPKLAKW